MAGLEEYSWHSTFLYPATRPAEYQKDVQPCVDKIGILWHELKTNPPLDWQDRQGGQLVVVGQIELARMRISRKVL